ncbi:TPA: fimbria/pilus periplasmic chaperone [Enterobacter bugandensis]|nr:fimbria/pilus periplasmic chaperone [Enterobacter bugandensis]
MFLTTIRPALLAGLFTLAFSAFQSQASIVVSGTRVVYPGNEREITVKLSNTGKTPVLVQSWIDKGDVEARPEKIQVPFILTPPINRINPDKSQTLRLSYTGLPHLPEDKESVYWLNVLEIPPVTKAAAPNRIQVAFRTRIKLFYRPAALNDRARVAEAAEKINWTISNGELKAANNSPYFISLASVTLTQGGRKTSVDGEMISPMSSRGFQFKERGLLRSGSTVSWEYVNDWGAVKTGQTTLQ